MKYKDYIEKLPYELQDKILDLVFNDVKNEIKNVIKPKNNSLIYNYSINKVVEEFDFYYLPLKLMCCLYSDLNDLSKKINYFINNDHIRRKIAKKGRDKYFKYFNSKIVAEFILNKTFHIEKKYFWE